MLVFKCSCGCFFSISETRRDCPRCANCGQEVPVHKYTSMSDLDKALNEAKMTMQIIPDGAKINISFDI